MYRRVWYIVLLAGMVAVYAFACLKFDKFGAAAPATLCGAPVWIITAIVLGAFLLGGTRYRPIVDPGEYGETPGCLFTLFIGFFFLAMFLGIVFTEPIICTARDGDACYEYGTQANAPTVYNGTYNNGSHYRYTYRNSWVWITDPFVDVGLSGAGSWITEMDLDDSEAMIFIVIVIVLLIIVLSSAFIPNMWVLACALCIGATYLTILRLDNAEKAGKRKTDNGEPPDKLKKVKNSDPLLAEPEFPKIKNDDFGSLTPTQGAP